MFFRSKWTVMKINFTYDNGNCSAGLYCESSSSRSLTRVFNSLRSVKISFSSFVVNLGLFGSSKSYMALLFKSGKSF